MKTSIGLLLGLLITGLTFGGCERMEPEPLSSVVLQSAGTFTQSGSSQQDAILQIQEQEGALLVAVQERESHNPIVSAFIPAETFTELLAEAHGPMKANLSGATLRVAQPCSLQKPLAQFSGKGMAGAVQVNLSFEGNRWLQYNSGLLERGLEGRISVIMTAADGSTTAQFDGIVSRQRPSREHGKIFSGGPIAVGSRAAGHVEGSASLGGTLLGSHAPDATHGNPATISLALPNGAGKVEIQGQKQVFDFDPKTDVTYPKGEGTIRMLTQNDNYIEVEDVFQGHINLPRVELLLLDFFGKLVPTTGTGTGDFSYRLAIAIEPSHVLVVTAASLSASLKTSEGKSLDFATDLRPDGSIPQTNTELDW